jgi:two-component system LytT family response regulator
MTEYRAVVADDEPLARRGVRQLLARYPGWRVVAECRDGAETLTAIARHRPDAVFLDIAMPGIDGLGVARRAGEHAQSLAGPILVFLTAHSRHAVEAFDTVALDYLVKPVSVQRFGRTMQRLHGRLEAHRDRDDATLLVSQGRAMVMLPVREVDWVQSADHYARVWSGSRSALMRESLDALEGRLAPHGFLRVHRSALVRLAAIRTLRRQSDGELTVVLASGAKVPVSRRRAAALVGRVKDG